MWTEHNVVTTVRNAVLTAHNVKCTERKGICSHHNAVTSTRNAVTTAHNDKCTV